MKKQRYYFVIVSVLSLILFLWIRLLVITTSYEYQNVLKKKEELTQENRKLNIEYTNIASPSKVEAYAKDSAGLNQPKEKQYRYIKK